MDKSTLYLAHIAPDGREQTVLEHLEGTAHLCAEFADAFDAAPQGRPAGLAHDLGKFSQACEAGLSPYGERGLKWELGLSYAYR